jgi:N-acyl homoserine lactone hydrolase
LTELTIRPIALCQGPRDLSHYTYTMNQGKRCSSGCYIWYIEGAPRRILVDTGATADMIKARGVEETDLVSTVDALKKLGLAPRDIEIVIVTHLHFDHIGLGHLYANARFIVQKKELEYARKPHPIDAGTYNRSLFDNLKFEVIDGEKEIVPGVSVFPSPGHTPGGQSVMVKTSAGKAVITGFCGNLRTFEQSDSMAKRGWQVAIPLLHHDTRQMYDSVLEVKRRADIILPLHEETFIGRERIP